MDDLVSALQGLLMLGYAFQGVAVQVDDQGQPVKLRAGGDHLDGGMSAVTVDVAGYRKLRRGE